MSHTVKLFERIINPMLRTIVDMGIPSISYLGKDDLLWILQETYQEKQHDLHMVSSDRLSLQGFDMEHHVNDRDSRWVRQCAETV